MCTKGKKHFKCRKQTNKRFYMKGKIFKGLKC